MDVFAVAARMLGDMPLSPSQLAQLRAINTKYYRRVAELLREGAPAERALTAEESDALYAMLVADVRAMLTPEQRRSLGEG